MTQSTATLKVFIPGKPEPQGSVKGFPIRRAGGRVGVCLTTDNPKLKGWRGQVVECARRAMAEAAGVVIPEGSPLALFGEEAVCVCAEFILPRPASAPKTAKGKALGPHRTKPDLDKLQRATGDALTQSRAIKDDSAICQWNASKRYALLGETAGTLLEVTGI